MNAQHFIRIITVLLIAAGALGLLSCFGNNSGAYIIQFDMDGTTYSYTKGYVDITGRPEGSYAPGDSPTHTYLGGIHEEAVNDEDDNIRIKFDGKTTRTLGDTELDLYIKEGGTTIVDTPESDFSLTVEKYGEIGGVISGTFSGDVWGDSGGKVITNGYFKVERIEDGQIGFPQS